MALPFDMADQRSAYMQQQHVAAAAAAASDPSSSIGKLARMANDIPSQQQLQAMQQSMMQAQYGHHVAAGGSGGRGQGQSRQQQPLSHHAAAGMGMPTGTGSVPNPYHPYHAMSPNMAFPGQNPVMNPTGACLWLGRSCFSDSKLRNQI